MARPLTAEERLRYPWASRIVDYVPVGRLRRVAVWAALGGLAYYAIGLLAIFFFSPAISISNGLPAGTAEYIVMIPAYVAMAVGFCLGLVTLVSAIVHQGKSVMMWSVGAILPGVLILALTLVLD